MIQVFGRKKCRDTQALVRYLKERSIPHSYVDMDVKAPSPGELDALIRFLGEPLVLADREGKAWKSGGWEWRDEHPRDLLLEHPELLRTPLVRTRTGASAGRDEAFWQTLKP